MRSASLILVPMIATLGLFALTSSQEMQIATIRGENVRVYTEPDSSSSFQTLLQRGDSIMVMGEATMPDGTTQPVTSSSLRSVDLDAYIPVETMDGSAGWVMELFVDPNSLSVMEPPDATRPADQQRQRRAGRQKQDQQSDQPVAAIEERSAATSTAVPATPPALNSGGLGLTTVQFEELYGVGVEDEQGIIYETANGSLLAQTTEGEIIGYLERYFEAPASLNSARLAAIQRLGPADAKLVETYVTDVGVTVDLYSSASLAAVLPDPAAYPDGEPGNFTVSFGDYSPDAGVKVVSSFKMALGNDPEP